MTLTNKIFIAMAAGIAVGTLGNFLQPALHGSQWVSLLETYFFFGALEIVGKVFIASLKVLVVPLVFVSLVCGTASLGGHNSRMGVMAGKTIALYLLTTAIAISIALTLALIIEPGAGNTYQSTSEYQSAEPPALKQVLVNIFPSNPVNAMA